MALIALAPATDAAVVATVAAVEVDVSAETVNAVPRRSAAIGKTSVAATDTAMFVAEFSSWWRLITCPISRARRKASAGSSSPSDRSPSKTMMEPEALDSVPISPFWGTRKMKPGCAPFSSWRISRDAFARRVPRRFT